MTTDDVVVQVEDGVGRGVCSKDSLLPLLLLTPSLSWLVLGDRAKGDLCCLW